MRRRSLAGPLLLILIGLLFLSRNVWPGLISFDAVARYWPLILVAVVIATLGIALYPLRRQGSERS